MCITHGNIKMASNVHRDVDEVREESLQKDSAADLEKGEKLMTNDTQDY